MIGTPETLGEVGRMLESIQEQIDRRFREHNEKLDKFEKKIDLLENRPKDSFRMYVLPILTSVIAAILILLITQGGIS